MNNINKRHRLAQMASRASIEFYVGLALQGRLDRLRKTAGNDKKGIREEAFVIRVFKNGLAVFVSK